jgi:ferredoxin
MPTVKFVNEKVTVQVQDGEDLRSVARKNGVEIYSGPHKIVNCMGFGTCCSCNVIIRSGEKNCSRKGILESVWKWLNPLLGLKILSNADKDVRLACQTRVHGDVEVETHPPINWHGEKFWS